MKMTYLKLAILAGLALAALAACHDAIFATIETEQKSATNTLSQTLTVVDIEATTPGSVYTVAAGGIFRGTLSGVAGTISWDPNSDKSARPYNPSGMICNVMALFPATSRLYGGFIDSSEGTTRYYQSDASYSFASATPTATRNGQQVTYLHAANGTLFMGGADITASVFELDYSADGVNWNATNLTGLGTKITGVVWDGTNYWAASGSTLYRTTAGSLSSFAAYTVVSSGVSPDLINGVFADGTRVFLVTKTKGIFYSLDGGTTWINQSDQPSGSANPASFLCVAGPVSGTNIYLVGSDGFGYYTLDVSANDFTRFDDTTILLYTASIANILVDKTGQENVLLGTNGQGVWRGVFDPGTGQVLTGTNQYWIHE